MNTPDLFTYATRKQRTRRSTMDAAYAQRAPSMAERILAAMREHFPDGCTTDEMEIHLGGRHQSVSARFNDMMRDGRIVATGRTRKTSSGRDAIVWQTTMTKDTQ